MNNDNVRYFSNYSGVVDLSKVDAISASACPFTQDDGRGTRDEYQIALKSGAVIKFIGTGLNKQYKQYLGITGE